jgi:hypothetical protein
MTMNERRKNQDRRRIEMKRDDKRNRRVSPDRRLNSISAVWIPFNNISLHPLVRNAFRKQ